MKTKKSRTMFGAMLVLTFLLGSLFAFLATDFSNDNVQPQKAHISIWAEPVWHGDGVNSLASAADNWEDGWIPDTGEVVVFNNVGTSKNCTWDIAKTFAGFYVNSSYSGTITQTVDIGVTSFSMTSGIWIGGNFKITDSGNFSKSASVGITGANLVMTGGTSTPNFFPATTKYIDVPTALDLTSLRISGVVVFRSGTLYTNNLTIDSGKTLFINQGLDFNFRCGFATTYLSNVGSIRGPGNFKAYFTSTTNQDTTLSFGDVRTPVYAFITSTCTRDSILTLGANTVFGSSLSVYSQAASYSMTFSTGASYTLSITRSLSIGAKTTFTQGTGLLEVGNITLNGANAVFTQGGNIFVKSGQIHVMTGTFTQDSTHYIEIYGNITESFGGTYDLIDENSLYSSEIMWSHPEDTKFAITHQGDCNIDRPAGTLSAYDYAFNVGARQFEFDARITLDGYWVVQHDATWNSATNGSGNVSATNWIGYGEYLISDLFTYYGTYYDQFSLTQEPVLLVSTLLDWAKDKNIILWLDNKIATSEADTDLHTLINNSGAKNRIIMECPTLASLNRFPDMLRCYSLFGWVTTHPQYEAELLNAYAAGAQFVTVSDSAVIGSTGYSDAHNLGIGVFACWNFDWDRDHIPPASVLISYLNAGANAVLSNSVHIAVQVEQHYEDHAFIYADHATLTIIPRSPFAMTKAVQANGNLTISISGYTGALTIIPDSPTFTANITVWDLGQTDNLGSAARWTIVCSDTDANSTYVLTGLRHDTTYRVYKDGSLVQSGFSGPTITFIGMGNGSFEVQSWYPASIIGLTNLIFLIFAVGIVVGVIAEGTYSLRRKEMPTTQQMMKSLLNMVIYIIIGLAGVGILYSMLA